MRPLPAVSRALVSLLALLLFAFAGAAAADTPPAPTCFYEVAGVCDGTYGTPGGQPTTEIVDVDETVTLSSGFDPSPPFGTPVNTPCGPGSQALCIYSGIAWKIATPRGLLQSPIAIQDNTCGGESLTCKFTYKPRAIGNEGDFWQTFVAAYQHGSIPISKRGWAIYARPRFRWVTAHATGAEDYKAGIAYAVRGGTNPTYAACIDEATINPTSSTDFDCVRSTGGVDFDDNPVWKFALPSGSGSWDLIIDPVKRTESGPTHAPGLRWQSRSISVANSDIEETVSHLPLGTPKVAIDTDGSQIQVGTKRKIHLVVTSSGGTASLDNLSWEFDYLTKQSGSSSGIVVENATFDGPSNFTLLQGETATFSVSVRAEPNAVGGATLVAKLHWRDPSFDEHTFTSDPATLTAVTDPVPPPDDEGGDGVPKPPIPTAATSTEVKGHVSDEPLTSYEVTWFAAPSCDATDVTSHLIGTRTVATAASGEGDASVTPSPAPVSGEAVFGYSTLNGVRSDRSDCVTVAAADGGSGSGGSGSSGSSGATAPLLATSPATTLKPPGPIQKPPKLTPRVPAAVKADKRFSLTVDVGGGAAGTVTVQKGHRRIAGPVKVKRGSATLKLKLPKGRQQLTLVFTPAGGGRATTKTLTLNVGS
jgi:hypothetical protein